MKKKILFFVVVVIISLFKIDSVSAFDNDSILRREFVDNVWSFHYRNGSVWTYGQLNIKHINNKIGYCIEPDSAVNTDVYSSTNDWSISTFGSEEKRLMELYAYYGYQYQGHQTIRYYMATQELIWLLSPDERILWTVADHSDSEKINIDNEKNEILRLVSQHNKLPSFSGTSYKAYTGESITFTDSNNVLSNYKVNSDISYTQNNNKLTITIPDRNAHTISFTSKGSGYNETTVYYANIRSQRIATFASPSSLSSNIAVIPDKIKVVVNKKDSETKELIEDVGNKFKIKDVSEDKYLSIDGNEEFEVPDTGKYTLYLPNGEYEIEEISASNNYYINEDNLKFDITDDTILDDYNYNIDFYNKKVKGKVRINKVDDFNNFIEGCIFEIYDEDMNVVDKITTTNKEYDESKLLDLGKYYLKEIKTVSGYIIDDKLYEIELKYKDDKTPIIQKDIKVTNKNIRCEVVLINLDNNDSPIYNTKIEVYNSKDELVYSGKTDKDGKVMIKDLVYGDYYFIEKSISNRYIKNNNKVKFTVNDDFCLSSLKIYNDKNRMPKTTTKNIDILSLLIFILNIGIINAYKKSH